jgi:hypothetical protein
MQTNPATTAATVDAAAAAARMPKYRYITGIGDGIRRIWRHEHIRGLFRGLTPRVCLTSMQSAIMFFIYERALARMAPMWTEVSYNS